MNEKKPQNTKLLIVVAIAIAVILLLANFQAFITPIKGLLKILAPIIAGFVIAYLCNYMLVLFEDKIFRKVKNRKFVRVISLILTYLIFFGVLYGFSVLIIPQAAKSVVDLVKNGKEYLTIALTKVNAWLDTLPFEIPNKDNFTDLESLMDSLLNILNNYATSITTTVTSFLSSVVTVIIDFIVAIFVSIYTLIRRDKLKVYFKNLEHSFFSEATCSGINKYLKLTDEKFGGFIIGKIIDSIIIGILTYIVLTIVKMPSTLLVSVIVCVTNVVPVFGPFIGAIPSALIIFIQDPMQAIWFSIIILIIQQLDGHVIGPFILGDSTGLSPLAITISVVLWGGLFGFIGMVIGVPFTALILAVIDDLSEKSLREKNMKLTEENKEIIVIPEKEKKKSSLSKAKEKIKTLIKNKRTEK